MLRKLKNTFCVVSLLPLGFILLLFLNGNSNSNLQSESSYKSRQDFSSQINFSDSFKCGTMEIYDKMISDNPNFVRNQRELEAFTGNYIKNIKQGERTIVTIPVVVHIVYNTPQQNISNATVQSQIDVLNKDFRRLNEDTINTPVPFKHLGGDPLIEFTLAKRDPLGNPSIGITRTQTSVSVFVYPTSHTYVMFTSLGGHDIWDRDKYLNLWVCNLSGLTGYAQLPGNNPAYDGAVVHYTVFGTVGPVVSQSNKGRTATHEIGHWFNLWHIWGINNSCGSDSVSDTPTQQAANVGCPSSPHITCNNGPYGDMFTNYMDYTTGDCQNIFTIGQSNRMNAALYGARSSLLSSNGGIPVSGFPIAHFRSDKMTINLGQSINFYDESGGIPTSWQWIFEGGTPSTSNQQNPTVNYSNAGFYSVKLKVTNSFGTDSVNYVNYVKVLGVNMSPFILVYPPSNAFINTSASDTTRSIFTWTKSSSHPTIIYKWKIRKDGGLVDLSYNSDNNGSDSLITLRNSFLDSLALNFGGNSDTVVCLWKVYSYNGSDSLISQNANFIFISRHTVGIKVISASIPEKFKLYQNYPNPFNPSTIISFQLPTNSYTTLKIYDITGRVVETLINENLKAGTYQVSWNASKYSSGIYFYRIQAGEFTDVKRLMLVK
jgi:PKD repeat protein